MRRVPGVCFRNSEVSLRQFRMKAGTNKKTRPEDALGKLGKRALYLYPIIITMHSEGGSESLTAGIL
jgi:hypothetical protein